MIEYVWVVAPVSNIWQGFQTRSHLFHAHKVLQLLLPSCTAKALSGLPLLLLLLSMELRRCNFFAHTCVETVHTEFEDTVTIKPGIPPHLP